MKSQRKRQAITIYGCSEEERQVFESIQGGYDVSFRLFEEELAEDTVSYAKGCECISINHSVRVTPMLLDRLYQLGVRYISTRTMGYDHIDVAYASSIGIYIGNIRYSPYSVADYAIMLMLMATRQAKSLLKRTEVQNYSLPRRAGREIQDLTVGVVGTGCIGSTVISHLSGFGTKILAYDRYERNEVKQYATYVSFDELLEKSDVITLHMPAMKETRHMINRSTIARMKQDAYIINTGRGSLIDTEALIDGIESGKLAGAALDVLENEMQYLYQDCQDMPLANFDFALLNSFPNVVITPHMAFYTEKAVRDMVVNSVEGCIGFLNGKEEVVVNEVAQRKIV